MKVITKLAIVVSLMIFYNIKIQGQQEPSIIEHEIYPNWYYINNAHHSETRNNTPYLTTTNFIPICKSEFNLTTNDELVIDNIFFINDIVSSTELSINNRITKYQQYYNGYKVESSLIFTQDSCDTINLVLGELVENLSIDTSNPISKEQALSIAINALESPPMYLDNTIMNEWCLNNNGFFDSICYNSFLPHGELCISRKSTDSFDPGNFHFVWKYNIIDINGSEYRILIDAQDGNIYDITNITVNDNYELGSLQTLYDGYHENVMETFRCTLCLGWKLKNSNGNITHFRGDEIFSFNNIWLDEGIRPAYTAHWVIYELDDYYGTILNNTNLTNDVKINIKEENYHNASYANNLINIGYTQQGKSFAATDVISHELAHKLIRATANLEYYGESGALNESFADIFGVLAEKFIRSKYSKPWNWTIGEDIGIVRSLSNPKLHQQPDYYKGDYWYYGIGDNGGVHCNSGVQNKWFYNLSQSIGVNKAELIAYTTLCCYLTPTSEYHDALYASVFAAENLYGKCSVERNAVISAWNNVGVSSNGLSYCHNANDLPPVQSLMINEDKKTDNLLIYPNPADNYIIIELSDELLNGSIVLYNHLGVVEYRGEINSHSIRIETDRLNNGIHFIKIVSDNQIIKLQKIIVNK